MHEEIHSENPLDPLEARGRKNETRQLQELVAHYLAHDGYIETAKAFAEEAQGSQKLLLGGNVASDEFAWKEDPDAINRQST